MEKKKYDGLAMEIVGLDDEDVITSSSSVSECNGENEIACSDPESPGVILVPPINPPVSK